MSEYCDCMRSLIDIITSVLNSDETIPELPEDKLVAIKGKSCLEVDLDRDTAYKIARLQTLAVMTRENGEIPNISIPDDRGSGLLTMANSLTIQEDATNTIMMLERLLVEIVRKAVPSENERFGVRYFLDGNLKLCYSETPASRFLD